MIDIQKYFNSPNCLESHYSDFKVTERILLTGHSHQAWPNVAYNGLRKCWEDAAELADLKWERASEKADEVRAGFAKLMNDNDGFITLSANTHDLLLKFLSSLDWSKRKKIITTDMEFHTVRRQLDRLAEEVIVIVKVPAMPAETVSERIAGLIDDETTCVIISKVFYKNGRIAENLGILETKCLINGAYLLVDAYHVLNILPFDINSEGLKNSFIIGGGYKYCQLGEGNCFMRFPSDCQLRPVFTGWFSEFNKLADVKKPGEVPYGEGHFRFAGSTYDPVSHYRAVEVFQFFRNMELTPEFLREINQHQIQLMAEKFDKFDLDDRIIRRDSNTSITKSGGFLVLESPVSGEISKKLFEYGIYTDYRGESLRLGPAPYISDDKLNQALDALNEIVKR